MHPFMALFPTSMPRTQRAVALRQAIEGRGSIQRCHTSHHQHRVAALLQLASIGLANEEAHRRDLREMLFTSPGIANHISGVVRGPVPGPVPSNCLA